jgi:Asp-tRNA(Asn)/Glu-tRNA(Gln) amidotransferase B subunit
MEDVTSAEVFDVLAGLQHGTLKMTYARHERDKRLFYCTVKYVEQPSSIEDIKNAVTKIVQGNRDKVVQARQKPALTGWFVGQTMKALNGLADPEAVCLECNKQISAL